MRKLILAACLALASLTLGHAAHAGCPVPNPNLQAPPFYDGCQIPAIALNRLGAPGPVFSPLAYGAKCDGVTDDTTALNATGAAAVATGGSIAWPAKTCYSATGVTFAGPISIRGTSFVPSLDSGLVGSALECPNTITTCLKLTGGTGNLNAVSIRDLFVYGKGTTPTSGSTGIWQANGAVVTWQDVASVNWDTCTKFSSSSSAGIRMSGQSIYTGACFTHAYTIDGWPEILINGGAADIEGSNSVAATGQNDFIFGTNTACTTGGCGPNTINFENYNFITNGGVSCFFNLAGNQHPTDGVVAEFRFLDDHVEFHDAATAPAGLICTDSTIPLLANLYVTNMLTASFQAGGAAGSYLPLFSLNSNTALNEVHFSNNSFDNCTYSGGPNMALIDPSPASGAAVSNTHFDSNDFCSGISVTSNGVGSNKFLSTGNIGALSNIAGSWADFESMGDGLQAGFTDTATGHVAIGSSYMKAWTPVLQFCTGSSCSGSGITYSTDSGSYSRTSDGGFTETFAIVLLTNTAGSGTSTEITGEPAGLACTAANIGSGSIPYVSGFASASISVPLQPYWNPNVSPVSIGVQQAAASATGYAPIPYSAWVAGSTIYGSIHCAHTT